MSLNLKVSAPKELKSLPFFGRGDTLSNRIRDLLPDKDLVIDDYAGEGKLLVKCSRNDAQPDKSREFLDESHAARLRDAGFEVEVVEEATRENAPVRERGSGMI